MFDLKYIELVKKYTGFSEMLSPDTTLQSIGLTSLSSVSLILDLEEAFEMEVQDKYLTAETFATLESLWNVVQLMMQENS